MKRAADELEFLHSRADELLVLRHWSRRPLRNDLFFEWKEGCGEDSIPRSTKNGNDHDPLKTPSADCKAEAESHQDKERVCLQSDLGYTSR